MVNDKDTKKAYETALRTTDIKVFRKSVMSLTVEELNSLTVKIATRKSKAQNHITLINGFYLNGRITEKQYEKLCTAYPNLTGIGYKVTERTKAGKLRDMHINPNAVKLVKPDDDLQLIKILNVVSMDATLKNELIEAGSQLQFAHKEALVSANKAGMTDADRKQKIKEYETALKEFNNVVSRVECATGIISKAHSLGEKLIEILEHDMKGRVLKNQSVANECVSKQKWIQSVFEWRERDTVTADFLNICKELGLEQNVLHAPKLPKEKIKALEYGKKSAQFMKERERLAQEAKEVKATKTKQKEPIAANA